MPILKEFLSFLKNSPTVFHAAAEIASLLKKGGFHFLHEGAKWQLEKGKCYALMRANALVAAFRIPETNIKRASILASHIDSPCLKIKPHPDHTSRSISQLLVEVYGSPILHSWLDRDLLIAGRVATSNAHHLVKFDAFPIIIPQLAIHLDRLDKINPQEHLKAVVSIEPKSLSFLDWIKKQSDLDSILGFDLFLVSKEEPSFIGLDAELIASPRLDNLTSAFASLHAILESQSQKETLQMAFFWDHEEVGSKSCLGADSRFADELIERICLSMKMDREEFFALKSRSICFSSDAAHGFHPNFPEKYDPQNAPLLGGGPVLKYNANQKYATDGLGSAMLHSLAKKHKITLQSFASRSDISTGSTVGSIMAAQLGITTVDLGIASWAMHSIRETIAGKDEIALCSLLKVLLEEG